RPAILTRTPWLKPTTLNSSASSRSLSTRETQTTGRLAWSARLPGGAVKNERPNRSTADDWKPGIGCCHPESERAARGELRPPGKGGDKYRPYTKSYFDCVREVVGEDPIATILDCLFTAGYCDMFEFADAVLGAEGSQAAA